MKFIKTLPNTNHSWINIDMEDPRELVELNQHYHIDQEMIDYALDQNERAHFEYNRKEETFLLIYVVPKEFKEDHHYETTPITFLIKDDVLFTMMNEETRYLLPKIERVMNEQDHTSLYKLLFNVLFMLTDQFAPLIEGIERKRKVVNLRLRQKANKKNLLELSDLEIGNTYLFSAAKQDAVVLEQLRVHFIYNKFNELEKEELEDTIIEAKQLVEMASLSSQVLNQLSGTYNNILNNSLNDVMRVLTVLSVLLTIPTIITGFFGMNVPLPLEHNVMGWLIIILLSLAIGFVLTLALRQFMRR